MKKTFGIILVLIVTVAFLSGCQEAGTVSGMVSFSGVPCPKDSPDYRVPPCTGPYPSYEVGVFKKGTQDKPVSTLMCDADGKFKLELPAGDYVIYTQQGISKEKENMRANEFSVKAGADTQVDLQISTGIQ